MAIPFLAVIVGGVGVVGVATVDDARTKMNRAKEINRDAQRKADAAKARHDKTRKSTDDTLTNLGKTKISIMASSMNDFVENYKRIRNVNFNDKVGHEELRNFNEDFRELQKASFNAVELAKGGVGSIAAGALTAAGAYGTVGALATASTGTAISALSGAAATNATLAWLGGGAIAAGGGGMAMGTMVLGGLVAAPALIITGLFMSSKADKALSEAKSQLDEAKKYAQDVKNLCTVMEAISARANQIDNLLNDLNGKFRPVINQLATLISNRGTDFNYYSTYERDFVHSAVSLAKTIKIVINTSLLREDGSLCDDETQHALTTGQKMLQTIN
ncbi:MAG: hypothetical protein IJK81_06150 [Selenomonadaceae bacterium]|nr:hypothetical protein [Selenomonadaceae bacterium]